MSKSTSTDITRQLLDGITTGRFPVGTLLPTEFELCEQFQASRYTVRAVLQELQQLGLVSRRKNVGTRVEAAQPKAVFRPTLASVEDLVQFGTEHLRAVQAVEAVAVPADVANEIKAREKAYSQDLQRSGKWRHIWRIAGQYANVSIFDVENVDELHALVSTLPLFPYMTIEVQPLCRHPSSIRQDDR